jgi:hypothetical protein
VQEYTAVSHLLFADDSPILMNTDMKIATSVQRVLGNYCANPGQLFSVEKSSVYFSLNIEVDTRENICQVLHIDT